MHQIITLAEGAANELPFPTFVVGAIAMCIFILLGVITWSYRDVANRHDHKANNNNSHH
jgi:glucose uptake protein GlcU